jgi:basic membrane protein A
MKKCLLTFFTIVLFIVGGTVAFASGQSEKSKAAGPAGSAAKKIKVAFVYVGPHNDGGWSQAQNDGRLYLQKTLPNVETTYSENVPEGAPAAKVFRDYANQGYKIIFGTSFGYMDPMLSVAKAYPNIIFEHCSGYKTAANMGTYFGRMYEADYLGGLVAGFMTKSNYIGFVAPFSTPEVVREIDAFTIGARQVNPQVEVHVIWTNSWFDPPKEGKAANTFLANGADIIASGVDSPAPLVAAQKAGKYGEGYDRNMESFAPKAVLTSRVWNWGPYFVKTVKAVEAGTWKPDQYWGGMKTGIVSLAPYGPMVPQKVRDYVDKRKAAIINGSYDPFNGPIYDQADKLMVQKGAQLSDADKLSIQWFVKGVIGSIPKSGS